MMGSTFTGWSPISGDHPLMLQKNIWMKERFIRVFSVEKHFLLFKSLQTILI